MGKLRSNNRRRYLRFDPNAEDIKDLQLKSMAVLAHVDCDSDGETFHPTLLGLLVDQSHKGCSVVFTKSKKGSDSVLKEGSECFVKAGALHPMRSLIRWRQELDEETFKIGFQFME